ncbi:glycosyltransferase family 4 protein [Acidimicrobiia bacterium EGI L10123]|uniref:glycosyltransferase family 4 protein n=1 Tax=Salinilacustrithrix flava TaxID=2957203 RepID=UPI003D7C1A8F|nr:glycosyltransferase family 4 protein [Acidimicrobiia bacterium EGI L10123]
MTSIAITNPYAWPHVKRGSETLALGLAGWLRGQGIDARLVAGGPPPRRYDVDGVPVHLVPAPDLRRIHHDLDGLLTHVPAMAAELARRRDDVVHALLYGDALAARLARRPYVVHYGGIAVRRGFDDHRIRWRAFAAGTRGAAAVISPSQAAADHLRAEFGVDAVVIPNAIDCARFSASTPTEPGRILCAATPDDARKRVPVLVAAFGTVARCHPDARLVLAGAAGDATRRELRTLVDPRTAERIEFLGDIDQDALAHEYARAATTCLPSLREAFGLVLVESLAAGTPAVGAHDGAIPEIVDDSVGGTFPPDDVEACATALLRSLELAEDRATAGACVARSMHFDWGTIGPRWIDLYRSVA